MTSDNRAAASRRRARDYSHHRSDAAERRFILQAERKALAELAAEREARENPADWADLLTSASGAATPAL